jgi:GST-like protein
MVYFSPAKNLARWYLEIAEREAVVKGYDLYKIGSQVPKV